MGPQGSFSCVLHTVPESFRGDLWIFMNVPASFSGFRSVSAVLKGHSGGILESFMDVEEGSGTSHEDS